MDDVEGAAVGKAFPLLFSQDDEDTSTLDTCCLQRRRIVKAAFELDDERIILKVGRQPVREGFCQDQ